MTPGLTPVLRQSILAASRSRRLRDTVERAPVSKQVVRRFVAGAGVDDAVAAAKSLAADGLSVSLDYLGEDTTDRASAEATRDAYIDLLQRLSAASLAGRTEVSLKLTAVGLSVDRSMAVDLASAVCAAAAEAGTTVTVDMEDHTVTDATLDVVRELRATWPWVGAVLQSYLRRTEADCRDLAVAGSRVRLCKGAYKEPESVAFQRRDDVDASYRRCLDVLMHGPGYPMVATHDPALVLHALALVASTRRSPSSYEMQMLYGIRPDEQRRLAAEGRTVRVYTPYGDEWYGYLMRRLAERPANVGFFLRAVATRS